MARSIHLRGVTRRFPNGPAALDDVSLDIQAGEFLALLGPSGCGKTTLLRLIAGFEAPTDGTLAFDERLVAGPGCFVQPEARQVAIVFQSYALWPHMSVGENVGYPLRVKGLRGTERARKVAEALAAVDLSGFEGRRPADLSGGQRQRVALARCLAMEPASCFWTSRSPISTCIYAPRWRKPSARSTDARARPWSMSPMIRPRPWPWRTGSR